MTVQIVRGDARRLPLADNTVDLVCTSPPYFALRSYTDTCQTCDGTGTAPDGAVGIDRPVLLGPSSKSTLTGSKANRTGSASGNDGCPTCGGTGQGHYGGQIGSESTPAEWLAALLEVTGECVRVLKPSGSLFVNLGDKYAGSSPVGSGGKGPASLVHGIGSNLRANTQSNGRRVQNDVPNKSLMGLPWRYALACIDDLGLILRAEIVWAKPNGLPESVTDRVRRSHETWFHFVLQPRYYSAVDEIREAQETANGLGKPASTKWRSENARDATTGRSATMLGNRQLHPLGKLPGSVWQIPSEPLTVPAELGVDHFAAFPLEWPRRIIRGWCPAEVCSVCGEGRRPVVDSEPTNVRPSSSPKGGRALTDELMQRPLLGARNGVMFEYHRTITGYVCACTPHTDHPGTGESSGPSYSAAIASGYHPNAGAGWGGNQDLGARPKVGPWREYHHDQWTPPPTTPGVVLDPFGGTGTTALAAHALGRDAIHVDLSADYNRIAAWRTTDRDQLAKAMQVTRSDQAKEADLFDMEALF